MIPSSSPLQIFDNMMISVAPKRHKPLASLLWLIPLISLSLVDPCFSAKVQHHNTMASLKQIKMKFLCGFGVDASGEGNVSVTAIYLPISTLISR